MLRIFVFCGVFGGLLSAWSLHAAELSVSTTRFGTKATLSASSALKPAGKLSYGVGNLIDGDPRTAWFEGKEGIGKGETLTVNFSKPVVVYGIRFLPGYAKSQKHFLGNAIPEFDLTVDGTRYLVGRGVLEHEFSTVTKGPAKGDPLKIPSGRDENLSPRYVFLPQPLKVSKLEVKLTGALSETGVDLDNGFSEFYVLTDSEMKKDLLARRIEALKSPSASQGGLAIDTPDVNQSCSFVPAQILTRQKFKAINAPFLLVRIKKALNGTPMRDGTVLLHPVFSSSDQKRLVFEEVIVDTCYADGEGGTQYLPVAVFGAKGLSKLAITPRFWPVP